MARSSKLNIEVQNRICDALRAGNTRKVAAMYGRVGETTFYRWMDEGKNATKGKKREFWEAVTRAEAECEVWHVANIKKQASGDWRASVEWLKRRKPEDWSEKRVVDNKPSRGMDDFINAMRS